MKAELLSFLCVSKVWGPDRQKYQLKVHVYAKVQDFQYSNISPVRRYAWIEWEPQTWMGSFTPSNLFPKTLHVRIELATSRLAVPRSANWANKEVSIPHPTMTQTHPLLILSRVYLNLLLAQWHASSHFSLCVFPFVSGVIDVCHLLIIVALWLWWRQSLTFLPSNVCSGIQESLLWLQLQSPLLLVQWYSQYSIINAVSCNLHSFQMINYKISVLLLCYFPTLWIVDGSLSSQVIHLHPRIRFPEIPANFYCM